jgi:hypothetical protein
LKIPLPVNKSKTPAWPTEFNEIWISRVKNWFYSNTVAPRFLPFHTMLNVEDFPRINCFLVEKKKTRVTYPASLAFWAIFHKANSIITSWRTAGEMMWLDSLGEVKTKKQGRGHSNQQVTISVISGLLPTVVAHQISKPTS